MTAKLNEISGLSSRKQGYKSLRSTQIMKEEKRINDVINVLENEYINPLLLPNLNPDHLINLSSGVPLESGGDELLNISRTGEDLAKKFQKERLFSSHFKFQDPIQQVKVPSFLPQKQLKLRKENKFKVIEANRNIIGRLFSISAKTNRPVNLEVALSYPLYPVPLSLANPDESKRSTQKSTLLELLPTKGTQEEANLIKTDVVGYVIDMIAQLRTCLVGCTGTFEDLSKRFVNSLDRGYQRIDIVADTYRPNSIKEGERKRRGCSSKIMIGSIKSKLPSDLNKFMLNNENKSSLINLVFDYIIENKLEVFTLLKTQKICLSGDTRTMLLTNSYTLPDHQLTSNQEEADTKLILHALHLLQFSEHGRVVVRNPSGDTDICVLLLGLIPNHHMYRVWYDYGTGSKRKAVWLNKFDVNLDHKSALIGFHSFTGNDYNSAFFRKGKKVCWNTMLKSQSFLNFFSTLGDSWEINDDSISLAEEYLCRLYGASKKTTNVNQARFESFTKKYCVENKIIDLSTLPPCRESLRLHLLRAIYVSGMWKRTSQAMIDLPNFEEFGWDSSGKVEWITDQYPDDIESMLFDDSYDSDEDEEEIGSDVETDNDEF